MMTMTRTWLDLPYVLMVPDLSGQILSHASSLFQPAQGFHITHTFVSQL